MFVCLLICLFSLFHLLEQILSYKKAGENKHMVVCSMQFCMRHIMLSEKIHVLEYIKIEHVVHKNRKCFMKNLALIKMGCLMGIMSY